MRMLYAYMASVLAGKSSALVKREKKTFVYYQIVMIKFVFSKKATKIDEIFSSEDFVNFCGLLRKHKLYTILLMSRYLRSYHEVCEKTSRH